MYMIDINFPEKYWLSISFCNNTLLFTLSNHDNFQETWQPNCSGEEFKNVKMYEKEEAIIYMH